MQRPCLYMLDDFGHSFFARLDMHGYNVSINKCILMGDPDTSPGSIVVINEPLYGRIESWTGPCEIHFANEAHIPTLFEGCEFKVTNQSKKLRVRCWFAELPVCPRRVELGEASLIRSREGNA